MLALLGEPGKGVLALLGRIYLGPCLREPNLDGILCTSQESHYSVFKAARMYRMDSVKVWSVGESYAASLS